MLLKFYISFYAFFCFYNSVPTITTTSSPLEIAFITTGATVALFAVVMGIIFFRKRQERNKRYVVKSYCYFNLQRHRLVYHLQKCTSAATDNNFQYSLQQSYFDDRSVGSCDLQWFGLLTLRARIYVFYFVVCFVA